MVSFVVCVTVQSSTHNISFIWGKTVASKKEKTTVFFRDVFSVTNFSSFRVNFGELNCHVC